MTPESHDARAPRAGPQTIAATLIEALPYIRRYEGQTIVVKFGGHAMGSAELSASFARDVSLMKQIGMHPVVVHGGGPQIKAMLDRLEIRSAFVDGLRVTDAATVEIVEMVLAGRINKQIVCDIGRAGGKAAGLSGKDGRLIEARKWTRERRDPHGAIESVVDLGFVGEPQRINPEILETFESGEIIPVIAPIGVGPEGETYNINADVAAGAIASALGASRLMMLTDVAGVLDADGAPISQLPIASARDLLARGVISGGMIPKIETCLSAVEAGVGSACVLDGRTPHAVLLELFTETGAGTLVTPD